MALNIVTIGGGTGQFHVLRALMHLRNTHELKITAIPTTVDSGSSSGILRLAYRIVAPGDISQCIFGLHPQPEKAAWLFEHRFGGETGLSGHSARNIIVTAALQRHGQSQEAMEAIRNTFNLAGHIAPVTFSDCHLNVELGDGTHLATEDEINNHDLVGGGGVVRAWLHPTAEPNPAALEAIRDADIIITCPGTLHCSIIPNFLVPGVKEALLASPARKIYVSNLMNRRGHVSDSWNVLDHVDYLETYLAPEFFDTVIANTAPLQAAQATLYRGEAVIAPSIDGISSSDRLLIAVPLLLDPKHFKESENDPIAHLRATVRHDPELLADALTSALFS